MSRIGNAPIPIPSGVEVVVDDHLIKVKGPKGNLEQETVPQVSVQVEDNQILVSTTTENRFSKAIQGTTRSLICLLYTSPSPRD